MRQRRHGKIAPLAVLLPSGMGGGQVVCKIQ